jgi:hypothetical protein
MYVWYYTNEGSQVWDYIRQADIDTIDARSHSIKDIVQGDYFQKIIPESWTKTSCADGKNSMCAKICGTKFSAFDEQFK